MRLQQRAGDKVLLTLAASLHELAKILRPDQVELDLLPVYERCLNSDEEIRERIFEHVGTILSSVPLSTGWNLFLGLARSWKESTLGGWRARENLASHLPDFLETFREHQDLDPILDMIKDALTDPFFAVREAATQAVSRAFVSELIHRFRGYIPSFVMARTLQRDSARYSLISGIARFSKNDSREIKPYLTLRARLIAFPSFVRCIRQFILPPPNQSAFEDFFLPALPQLSHDVLDVRLGLAQGVADLFNSGGSDFAFRFNVLNLQSRRLLW